MNLLDLVGQRITVQSVAPPVLGTEYKNVLVDSILSFRAASKYRNLAELHKQVYPYLRSLAPGFQNDPKSYNYVLFLTSENEPVVVGIPWLLSDTISIVSNSELVVRIPGYSNDLADVVRRQLVAAGILEFTVEVNG